ncbi:MAG TPA: sortase [Patescibacteria group bacterium]|nr:sortase [Patescibacteria group bacterium]
MNGLFPDESNQTKRDDASYVLPRAERRIEPVSKDSANPAADLIRRKIEDLYAAEPSAKEELKEVQSGPQTKHQAFMHELSTSGKSLAEIQSAWHGYYANLPDDEKRAVWQEFYAANASAPAHTSPTPRTRIIQQRSSALTKPRIMGKSLPAVAAPSHSQTLPQQVAERPKPRVVVLEPEPIPHRPTDRRSVATIRRQVLKKVRDQGMANVKAKHHVQSLAFGLGLGALVVLIFLFSFFNEVIIAPFIQPNNHAEATPIILSQGSLAPSSTPEVIIPKINVELPVIYGTSTNENDVENSLEDGVVHYGSTSVPGQQGNTAFFGHSSNNIFNPGKYKFAFVLLHEIVPGDIFYLTYNGKVFTYRVFQKQVVEPTDVWVLNPVQGKTATAALITCDPPGTSLHRLVVWGEQIDPDPVANTGAPAVAQTTSHPTELASNGPTLWSRVWHWATPW